MDCPYETLAQARRGEQPWTSLTWCPVPTRRPRPCDAKHTHEDAQGLREQPPWVPRGDFGVKPFTSRFCRATSRYGRAPHRRRRQVPKPADWWGQQNHSLKQKIPSGGRTSWVSASAHSTMPSQPHTTGVAEGLPCASLAGGSSQHHPQAFLASPLDRKPCLETPAPFGHV